MDAALWAKWIQSSIDLLFDNPNRIAAMNASPAPNVNVVSIASVGKFVMESFLISFAPLLFCVIIYI